MTTYLWLMALGTVLVFALYGLGLRTAPGRPELRRGAWAVAGLSLVLAAGFGIVLARVAYALLMRELDFEYDGIAALEQLLWFDIDCVCFVGGALGVVLGVLLANRMVHKGAVAAGMDVFAPFGALLVALFRLGEGFFGSYGTGTILPDGSPFAFFPFALEIRVDGGYSYWGWAVFVLSALFALVWAGVSFFALRHKTRKGLNFTLTLFFLALPQVLCESMRSRGLLWLFVHVEQLLCAVVLVGVLVFWILQAGGKRSWFSKWLPLLVTLVCAGLVVVTEFAIDGKLFDLADSVCYAFMSVVLVVIGLCGVTAFKRWNGEQ